MHILLDLAIPFLGILIQKYLRYIDKDVCYNLFALYEKKAETNMCL